ncbi:MAG: hypothetical protein NDI69_02545 [Bacteriovoracaceae bacterium]|nr:hypothetical protein [Bacteriovoracaceae bacterium]
MAIIKSERAQKLLQHPVHIKSEKDSLMKPFPGEGITLWVGLEWDQQNVKNLSFHGQLEDHQKIIFESMASLLIGKPIAKLDDLSIRECEAFLRDRNSESSIEGMTEVEENILKKVFQWIRVWPRYEAPVEFNFHSEKGPFCQLKLVDKITAIKAFLNSPEILTLYQGMARPELVDVEDLTVYIHAPYSSQREKSLFEELHILGVEAFQEENLNFIPDA